LALLSQGPRAVGADVPTVIKFVAPPYPRAAEDQRIMGRTSTRLTINPAGIVTQAKTITAHRVFEDLVLEALKQWQFKPSDREHVLEVTCLFEIDNGKCEGTDLHPITQETHVWAELPTVVHIRTGLQCIEKVDR
jgi:TonB family protein